jgi:hypothetical protein
MPLLPIDLPPGVVRNGTTYQLRGRWYDSNLIRWKNGQMQPIGGWERIIQTPFTGKVRGLLGWRDNDSRRWAAVGTSNELHIFNNEQFAEITPEDSLTPFPAGRDNSIYGLGWGSGHYGQEAYGTARSASGLLLEAAHWSLDNWGENLIACAPHEGNIYEWVPPPDNSTPVSQAQLIANAPIANRGIVVTEERHLVALGADGDPRRIAWSDQEDNTVWEPSATNAAGDLQLVTNGLVMCARRMPGQVLIWTDQDLHKMTYQGPPFFYGIERVGGGCGIIGPNAHMAFGNIAVWMSDKGFFSYDGVINPLESDVQDYVFNDINVFQGVKVTAAHYAELGEIWWFYPSANSVENNRYVIWNYRENHWAIGQLDRTAWLDAGVFTYPLAAGADNHIYEHEKGWTANGATRVGQIYAKSAPIELGQGDQVMSVRQILPDGCPNTPTCTRVSFEVQQTPLGPATTYGPYTFSRPDGYADARFTGRQAEMTVEATQDAPFRFGRIRLDAVPGGGR